ncbi:hypothetical protein [Paenibacillus sp. Z6-24]
MKKKSTLWMSTAIVSVLTLTTAGIPLADAASSVGPPTSLSRTASTAKAVSSRQRG